MFLPTRPLRKNAYFFEWAEFAQNAGADSKNEFAYFSISHIIAYASAPVYFSIELKRISFDYMFFHAMETLFINCKRY